MTSGDSAAFAIRKATLADLDRIKCIADKHKTELGFVRRPTLAAAITANEVMVADAGGEVVGFVHYHHRRDEQTTLYNVVVMPTSRRQGIGRALVSALRSEAKARGKDAVVLKCPAELNANQFYAELGFSIAREESGKHRPLNVWAMAV